MFTRSMFQALQDKQSIKCISCGNFWGERTNLYVCSYCRGTEKQKYKQFPNLAIKSYIRTNKVKPFHDNIINGLCKMLQNARNSILNERVIVSIIVDFLRNPNTPISGTDATIYRLSNDQTVKIATAIGWRDYRHGYIISHAIQRWRMYPWEMIKDVLHMSSYCYFGNFGEKPTNTQSISDLYLRNMSIDWFKF